MKFFSKVQKCQLSPVRQFYPCAAEAEAKGRTIYHLNIGQPDIHTPDALYDAIHNFRTPVLAYAASPGIPELISAIEGYYRNIGVQLSESDILVTTGGSEALQIAANCLLDDGDEVIVPGYTFIASIATIAMMNAIPVLAEIDESLTIDPMKIEALITPKTKAIMPVHMLGNPCDMDPIMEIAKKHNLYVIEDCCQAVGAAYHGKRVGTIGDMGAYSLNVFKTITTGDGGFVNNKGGYKYTGKVINTESLNVRVTASTGAKKATTLKKGANLVIYETKISEDMAWGRCDAGWVYLYYVDLTPASGSAIDARVVYNDNTIIYTDNAASSVAGTYSRMSVIDIYEYVGDMARTDLGWVSTGNLL